MKKTEILIATLGVSPQIVTITLDLLKKQNSDIQNIVSIYTNAIEVKKSLNCLDQELQRLEISHHPVLITGSNGPVDDFWTEADVNAFLQTIYREIKSYKQAGQLIHLMIAGGRKVMSAYALVAAQLLFDEDDRCWHLFSDFWQPGGDAKMHLEPGDRSILVPIPVLRWPPMATVTVDLAFSDDPIQVINHRQELQQQDSDLRIKAFLRGLRPAQRAVARLLAEGLDNQSISDRRGTTPSTVTKQISAIFTEWRIFFNQPEKTPVRDKIVATLSGYYTRHGGDEK